jgi:CRISPR-associated protein Csb2
MSNLAIAWEYLTGYCVASHAGRRERVEWPPHPARVFMAIAAAWFETESSEDDEQLQNEYEAEGLALRWLESLRDPEISLPEVQNDFERSSVDVFVPVNDSAGPSASILQSASTLTRDKQPRTFPRIYVGNEPCVLTWRGVPNLDQHNDALARLCGKVTRIGHSSSLVRMWIAGDKEISLLERECFVPDSSAYDARMRSVSQGCLNYLTECFGKGRRDRHEFLSNQIESLQGRQSQIKGKGANEAKAEIAEQIRRLESERNQVSLRSSVRPSISYATSYRRMTHSNELEVCGTGFDRDVLVLALQPEIRLSPSSSLLVTQTLRKTIMSVCADPIPSWISGHQAEGEPLQDGVGHITCVPLLSSGFQYSDGHLMGVGIAFPRSVTGKDRGNALRSLLINEDGSDKEVQLKLGRLGECRLVRRDWSENRIALNPETWTAYPNGYDIWASVTPVVLDRFPKSDRLKQRSQWTEEVIEMVANACVNIGLPRPAEIDVDTTSWQTGIPRASQKQRPLRGQLVENKTSAALGDGYPTFPAKGGNAARPQLHVWLRFSQPVIGPIILGAGRFLGYGLCSPWRNPR